MKRSALLAILQYVALALCIAWGGLVLWDYLEKDRAAHPPDKGPALIHVPPRDMVIAPDYDDPVADDTFKRLVDEEGLKLTPYRDTRGHLTIGIGINLDEGLTRYEAEVLTRIRLNATELQLAGRWKPYAKQPEAIRIATLDAAYQLGVDGLLEFHDMIAALEIGDYEAAAKAAEASDWDKETPRRVDRVVELFRSVE